MKVVDFLDELASCLPTPGGGSVSALNGALSAGLIEMVCRLTVQNKRYASVRDEMTDILERAEVLRERLIDLVDDDADAFDGVMAALSMPKTTPEEKEKRKATLQAALKEATEVPVEIAERCLELIKLSSVVAEKGNKNAITDAGVAALAAKAGLEGAILNARINLASIKDADYLNKMTVKYKELETAAEVLASKTLGIVDSELKA
ncbi:MAG: cyclodeaminase/cyclohydrolase family protein [Candidatus Diapherotrites archaeon]|nr:cyclodeaminase/cyclohydrolase family protein [Candidatus Diapherotrites archaeon]